MLENIILFLIKFKKNLIGLKKGYASIIESVIILFPGLKSAAYLFDLSLICNKEGVNFKLEFIEFLPKYTLSNR